MYPIKSFIAALTLFVFLACVSNVEEADEHTQQVQSRVSDSIDELDVDGAIFEGNLIDTVTIDGVEKVIEQVFVLVENEQGTLDTVYSEPDTVVVEDFEPQMQDVKVEDSYLMDFNNEFASNIYVEVWGGKDLSFDDGVVSGINLKRAQSLVEVKSLSSQNLNIPEGGEVLFVLALFRNENYFYFTELKINPEELQGEIKSLTLEKDGFLNFN